MNAQYTPRPNLKFIERNMILRPTTAKIDYSLHEKDPDSLWKGKNLFFTFFKGFIFRFFKLTMKVFSPYGRLVLLRLQLFV
jgi:hypothetical protein